MFWRRSPPCSRGDCISDFKRCRRTSRICSRVYCSAGSLRGICLRCRADFQDHALERGFQRDLRRQGYPCLWMYLTSTDKELVICYEFEADLSALFINKKGGYENDECKMEKKFCTASFHSHVPVHDSRALMRKKLRKQRLKPLRKPPQKLGEKTLVASDNHYEGKFSPFFVSPLKISTSSI